ncbi:hypothetical protein KUF71_007918 [Frankliniella fusca]|uniref:Integrase catalytic domain-containing protein n=1 Tax=Frankliniella fusca TaxID=407009 RepID=A0AAE1HCA6_9NEOP|nr:hypothetical protein KUF71_007918 [Frankliniella fusca]
MDQTTVASVNAALFSIFARWGCLPALLVSDNGPPFESCEFINFLTSLNITLKHSPIYHPASNAQAERGVGTAKRALTKNLQELGDHTPNSPHNPINAVYTFMFTYHNTPSTVTTKTPNELLLSFKPRTLLSQSNPKIASSLGVPTSFTPFREGDTVLVRFAKHPPVNGTIIRQSGSNIYLVKIADVIKQCHFNQHSLKP